MAVSPLVDLDTVDAHCQATRALHKAMARARPFVRLWANPPDGREAEGLKLRGIASDSQTGEFPFTKTDVATGVLKLRLDHFLSKWLISIPDDPDAKKNVVITVDHMGGRLRWSGLLHHWTVTRDATGVLFMEATFLDDRQFLKYMLGPPNPALPIPIFQFPRVLPIFGPCNWAISFMILINLMRLQGNWYTLPDDPFDWNSWTSSFDWSTWQVLIKAPKFLEDGSLWTLLATRMDTIESVIADALDDGKQVLTYRRILTVDGETPAQFGITYVNSCRNGTLVLEVVDKSGFYNSAGTAFSGNILSGFFRSVVQFGSGFVESTLATVSSNQEIFPDAYYAANFWGQKPGHPWIVIRDSKWSQVETSTLGWNPAGPVQVIVGGDNPYADQLAELIIQSVGNILGYFFLLGFSSAGDIAASVVMPYLVGTIAAWDLYRNRARAQDLGWVHLFETKGSSGEQNAWSLAALAAIRAAFVATESKTCHQFTLTGVGPLYPGLHFTYGDRIGSTAEKVVPNKVFVDDVEVMVLKWDYSGTGEDQGHRYEITVGTNESAMSMQERQARLLSKALDTLSNIGVHLIS